MLNLLAALFASLAPAPAPLAPPRQLERVGEFTVGDGCSTKRIAFSGDGETLAALSHGNELLVFAVATGQITTRRVLHSQTSSIALSPDGKRLAAVSTHLDVIDLDSGTTKRVARSWSRTRCEPGKTQPTRPPTACGR